MRRVLLLILPPHVQCLRLLAIARLFLLTWVLAAAALTALGDTPGHLRSAPTPGCYCHCAESRSRGGCAKMCEIKKYASRWWAKSCVKPHMQAPADDSGAGPHLPHPDHAEHAQL